MPEMVVPGPVNQERCIREAVCIHTKKIFDSCKDKDCIEDLRVYPTTSSQQILDQAVSVKANCAQLLYAYIDVEPVNFNKGFYTVDVRYFYRISVDAYVGAARPVEAVGLAVFDKRVMLFGSEGSAKIFSSEGCLETAAPTCVRPCNLPTAIVEAVDPLVLDLKLVDTNECRVFDCGVVDIPPAVAAAFGEDLVISGDLHRMYITLGQFSIIRLERDTQLLTPVYDYCVPSKECPGDGSGECQEDPCDIFRKVDFPVNEFFPTNACGPQSDRYQEVRASGNM